jgi:hypothetical protein
LTYLAFAQVSLKAGKLPEVLKSYAHAREYSSTNPHFVDVGVGVLEVGLA